MDIASIITFNIVLLAAILSPGPAFLYIMTTSLSRGRVAGFVAGLGLGTMAAIWTLLAILGLEVLIMTTIMMVMGRQCHERGCAAFSCAGF